MEQNSTISATIWNTIETFGKQIVTVFTTIILARLLDPQDFGLFGMVIVFVMIATALIGGGFTAALIYKENPTEKDYSSIFYFSLIVSVFLFLILNLCSTLIASFYGEPNLVPVIRWLSISFILGGLTTVHHAIYSRRMDFKTIAKIGLYSQLLSSLVSVIIAYFKGGVWALVFQSVCLSLFAAIFFFIKSPWKPKLIFNIKNVRFLFKYGANIMLSSLLNSFFNNLYYIIIGKFFSVSNLGYFVQANKIQAIPADKLQQIIRKVTFPKLTLISNSKERTEIYFDKIFTFSLIINFPLLLVLAALSKDVVFFLLGEKWIQIVPFVELLCFASLFLPIYELCSNILLSRGLSFFNLKIDIAKKILIIVSIFISINWGIIGLIIGQIINAVIFLIIHLTITRRFVNFKFYKYLGIIFLLFLAAVIPYFLIKYLLSLLFFNEILSIIIYGLLYFSIYIVLIYAMGFQKKMNFKQYIKF